MSAALNCQLTNADVSVYLYIFRRYQQS